MYKLNKAKQHQLSVLMDMAAGTRPVEVGWAKTTCAMFADMAILHSYTVRKRKLTLSWYRRKRHISAPLINLPKRKPVPSIPSAVAKIKQSPEYQQENPHRVLYQAPTEPLIINEERRRLIHDTVVQLGRGVGMHHKKPEIPVKLYAGYEYEKLHKTMMLDAQSKPNRVAVRPVEYIYWADIPIPLKSLKDEIEDTVRRHKVLHTLNGRHICLMEV